MVINKLDTFSGHRDCVYALEASAQSQLFYSAGGDGLVIEWDLTKPDLGRLIAQIPASVFAMALQPNTGQLWVAQNYQGIHVIDPALPKELSSVQLTGASIFNIQFYENQAFVATGDGTIIVLDPQSLGIIKHLKASTQSARSMAINPQTKEIAVGYSDCFIRVFDLLNYQLKYAFKAHNHSIFSLKYSPNYQFLLSGSRDAHLKAWDVWDNYSLAQDVVAHLYAINHIEYSPDNQYFATASMDKSIKIWDAQTFKLLKVIDKARHAGHGTSVNRLLWSGYQQTLLSASDDKRISVWQLSNTQN